MILVDLNQVMLSNLLQHVSFNKNAAIDESLVRHMVLSSLKMYKSKFSEKYGDIILCCDDGNYWRKDIFPYYKAHRKKDRDASSLDWNMIFEILNRIRDELRDNFPYKVLRVFRAEADDIIATLVHKYGQLGIMSSDAELILILSSDKDFMQLQKYANVEQYSPMQKKFLRCPNPARFLKEHIICGDAGDGVPNFLSPADSFINKKRQKPISTKKLEEWNGKEPEEFCDENMLVGYKRNQQLVDLDFIPESIQKTVLENYDDYNINTRANLFNYFVKHKLKNLMSSINEF